MRVWDEFLSERDKQHLAKLSTPPSVGFGTKPALLLIDNYRAGLGDEPLPLLESIEKYPLSMGLEAWEAVKHTQRLLYVCRQAGLLVVHTTMLATPGSPHEFYTVLRRRPTTYTRPEVDPQDDVFAIVPEVGPVGDEILLRKLAPSAFWGTPLVSILQAHGVDTLLVGGESTSGCVRATVVDAASHCLRATVVEECTYDRTQAAHAINLFDMHQKYADVRSIDEVCDWVRSLPAA